VSSYLRSRRSPLPPGSLKPTGRAHRGAGKRRPESEQAGGADVAERGSHQDGEDFLGDNGFADGGNKVRGWEWCLPRKNSSIISSSPRRSFRRVFRELSLASAGESRGNLFDGGFAVAIGSVECAFMATKVDNATETPFRADRQLESDDVAAENFSRDSMERSKLESSRSIQVRTKARGMSYSVQ